MEFTYTKQIEKRKKADALVIPFWKDTFACSIMDGIPQLIQGVLATKDFKGKEGEVVYLYVEDQPEKRFILLGLGDKEKATVESLRKSYGCCTKSCLSKQISSLNVLVPEHPNMVEEDLVRGVAEGLFLPNYFFHLRTRSDPDEPDDVLLEKVCWIGPQRDLSSIVEKYYLISQGVNYARDLVNGNADDITPQYLAQCAQDLSREDNRIVTTILEKKKIEKEKLGLLLAVNRGSAREPVLIIMEYRGNPSSPTHTVIVGKGITYDTGGLNLKPTGSMETMKCDMAGAAACLGTIRTLSRLQVPVNVTIVIPSTENCIDANSFKPGDVYTSYSGKTVEMMNSDAEGRLILADGLAYAVKNLKPTQLLDIATLTGAIDIALGVDASGLMSTSDSLSEALIQAGNVTSERLWRMPLFPEYKERLKSDIADFKSWNGRPAGANVAAMFLRQFVGDVPWAHIDIASTAYVMDPKKYCPKYGQGTGVRLLTEFLMNSEIKT